MSPRDSWYSQQLYKLLLVAPSPTEVCWLLDSNTALLMPLDEPWQGGRVALDLGHLSARDRSWYASSAAFVCLPASGPSIAPVNQPLRRSVVRELFRWLAYVHRAPPIHVLAYWMRVGLRRGAPYWTEYGLYRSFAFHLARGAHVFRDRRDDVAYWHRDRAGRRTGAWLRQLQESQSKMVKIYARRPGYRISDVELSDVYRRVRACA